jgi:hypothetical protein
MAENQGHEFFDVGYGIASISFTTVGNLAIATTGVAYHGIAILAGGTTPATVTLYDAVATATGNIIDKIFVASAIGTHIDRYIPVMAKYGIFLVGSGTGLTGVVFYGPKG